MKIENLHTGTDPNLTVVFLTESTSARSLIDSSGPLFQAGNYTVWLADFNGLTPASMFTEARLLMTELDRTGFKRASVVALDEACSVAQIMLAQNAQIVRRAVLVNPISRARASKLQLLLEAWQNVWPIPLPFRLKSGTFDIRHLQHRVACPLLIVKTGGANDLAVETCNDLASRAPSSWLVELPTIQSENPPTQLSEKFLELVREFIEVPAKRSQKNLGGAKKEPAAVLQTEDRKAA